MIEHNCVQFIDTAVSEEKIFLERLRVMAKAHVIFLVKELNNGPNHAIFLYTEYYLSLFNQ